MAAPALSPAAPTATYQYPSNVVKLRDYANSISKKVTDLKSKHNLTLEQISAHALSIAEAVERACAGRSLEMLDPFAAVAVEEIVRLFSSCCSALDIAYQKPRFGATLTALTGAMSRSRSPSPSPAESTTLDDYRVSLEAVKVFLRIENGHSQLVSSGTIAPLTVQSPTLLHNEISKSTVVVQVFKSALQTMANVTDGLPFPYKAVAQTVLQFHEHIQSYRQIDDSIRALTSKIDDFVKIVAKLNRGKINSGEEAAEAIKAFFKAVQSIILRLEILQATRQIKKFAAPTAVAIAVAESEKKSDHAQDLLNTALHVNVHNAVHEIQDAVHEIQDAQSVDKGNVAYTCELPMRPKVFRGRDEELRSLVDFAIDCSRPIRLAIMGAGGIGKTTLAKAVMHDVEVARTFRDRRFFVSAETAAGINDIVNSMIRMFRLSTRTDTLSSLLQHFCSDDRTLLVLDNLETIWNSANAQQRHMTEQVLLKLDTVASLTLIVTCRGADLPLDIEWANRDAVILSTLSPRAALATFTDIAGDVPVPDQPVRDKLLQEVDYMPLAVTLLAQLVRKKGNLQDLARRWNSQHTAMLFTKPNGRLDNVAASIQLSIAFLPSDNPAPLQLLSLCAQLPAGMRLPVRRELEKLGDFRDLDGLLSVIEGLALVSLSKDETIQMLSPIRLYVLEKHQPSAAHRASLLRIYYEIARRAPQHVDTHFHAALFETMPETSNLDALLLSELEHCDEPTSTELIDAINAVSSFSRHNVPDAQLLTALISRIYTIEHLRRYLAFSLEILADIERMYGGYDLSLESATFARSCYQYLGLRLHVARCDRMIAQVHRLVGDYLKASASLSAAHKAFYELGSRLDMAHCDEERAWVAYEQENYDDAIALCNSAEEVFLDLDQQEAAASCQELLGVIHSELRDYRTSQVHLVSALRTYNSLSSMSGLASCSCSLGDMYRRRLRLKLAHRYLTMAYDVSEARGNIVGCAKVIRLRSYIYRDKGNFALARELLLDAQCLYDGIRYARGLEDCAAGLARLDRYEKARSRSTPGEGSAVPSR